MNRHAYPAKGSVLLTTLALTTLMAVIAYAIYSRALATYRISMRNEYLARARAVADSEMDFIFFRIKQSMMAQAKTAGEVPSALSDVCDTSAQGDDVYTPVTARSPFTVAAQNAGEGWVVKRSVVYDFTALGSVGTQTATFSYFTVKVEVTAPNTPAGSISIRQGRRMNTSTAPIFQYNIFAQGDLEFAPGGHVTINGDIAANGSMFIGAATTLNADGSNSTMVVNAFVRYLQGKTFDTSQLANGNPILTPIWGTGEAQQVQTMAKPENLLGGLSANDIALAYGAQGPDDPTPTNPLFGIIPNNGTPDASSLAAAMNRVYHSVIAPPPEAARAASLEPSNGSSYLNDYPDGDISTMSDDPSIAALRAYNRAGLMLTVNGNGTMTLTYGGTATSVPSGVFTQKTMWDLREEKNVAITEIDVGALKTQIDSTYTNFNGLLYVYLANSTAAHPAAVRLVNGSATPVTTGFHGFSIATNAGLYVQGDYNTAMVTDPDGNSVTNPAMLMADAITVLSSAWNDANVTAQTGDSDEVIAAKHDPMSTFYSSRIAAAGTTTVGAGLLTGNITENTDGTYVYSGGGHNLIRFLENWHNSDVNFYGSIGRLFESTQFTSKFRSPNDGSYPGTYNVPADRTFTFNPYLRIHYPYGTPTISNFDRGTIFTW